MGFHVLLLDLMGYNGGLMGFCFFLLMNNQENGVFTMNKGISLGVQ
jgi:hypothetical protein